MLESKIVYIFGYSGHSYVIIESLHELGYTIKGYFDKVEAVSNPYNIEYCGYEADIDLYSAVNQAFVFPSVGEGLSREKLVNLFTKLDQPNWEEKDKWMEDFK